MEKVFISVIMGAFNSDPDKLLIAVNSILKQTYDNFELIICDDCSTDEKTAICLKQLAQKDDRVVLLHNFINMGLAQSLNNCIKVAKGKYIARMDDDDYSHPDRFEKQVGFLNNHPEIGLVGCAINLFDDNGIWGSVKNVERPQKEDFLFATPFTHPTIMVKKEAYLKVNGYCAEKRTKRTEDYDLFMRLYSEGIKGFNLQDCLFDYRMDSNGYKKQKFRYRIDEAVIKYRGFKKMGLLPRGYIYLIKPIVSGLIPGSIKSRLYKKRFK